MKVKTLLKAGTIGLGVALLAFSTSATAGDMPNGKHYNLNIIGVEKEKNPDMTNSNRHTIFMPLNTTGKGVKAVKYVGDDGEVATVAGTEIEGQIWLMPGSDFKVCDGNGFDEARGCDDEELGDWNTCAFVYDEIEDDYVYECGVISRKQGAVFQLPCNQNVEITDGEELVACETGDGSAPSASYEVWARPLGQPGGQSTMTTCADVQNEETDAYELQCSLEQSVQTRTKGKSVWNEVTQELTSMLVDLCVDGYVDDITGDFVCTDTETTRISLFAGDTEDWFWNYKNEGLRLLQLRFYDI